MSAQIPGREIAPPIPGMDGVRVSTSVGGQTRMPTVQFVRPKVAGEDPIDRGEAAEFEILHVRVGQHIQGSRVIRDDFPEGTDFDRLVRLEAVAVIDRPAPTEVKGK